MNSFPHSALIHMSLDVVGGPQYAKAVLHGLNECGNIVSISSVYKRFSNSERMDFSARLEFVLRFSTKMSVDQTLHFVLSQARQGVQGLKQQARADLLLLTFDNLILMSPRLTLPYPELHKDPLIIRCAAEAWGQYEHPIYQKNLNDISRTAPDARWAEFYMQGKTLVDF